jgi:hypothetical protein
MNLLQSLKNLIDGKKTKPEVETEIIKAESETVNLTPFEEKLNFLYMGCYNVNPVKPVITQELGNVHNQKDCINMGKNEGYQYIALQNGNECLAANNIDLRDLQSVPRTQCNMVCDESSAGFCGGVLKNQIYATSLPAASGNEFHQNMLNSPTATTYQASNSNPIKTENNQKSETAAENNKKETFRHLENFASNNKEMTNIGKNIGQIDMICQDPINKYNLFLSLLIILFLAYLLFEIVCRKQ